MVYANAVLPAPHPKIPPALALQMPHALGHAQTGNRECEGKRQDYEGNEHKTDAVVFGQESAELDI